MTERNLPEGVIEKDGIFASPKGIEGIPSSDGSGNTLNIIRIQNNHDWKLQLNMTDYEYMHPLRFPSAGGGEMSAFVGDHFYLMTNTFLNKPNPEQHSFSAQLYAPEGELLKGAEADDFELEVKGIQGIGQTGEFFDEFERFLDIIIYKNGNVKVTVRNREDKRDDRGSWPTYAEIAEMPITSASVLLNPNGKYPFFADTFASIARIAAHAIEEKNNRRKRR